MSGGGFWPERRKPEVNGRPPKVRQNGATLGMTGFWLGRWVWRQPVFLWGCYVVSLVRGPEGAPGLCGGCRGFRCWWRLAVGGWSARVFLFRLAAAGLFSLVAVCRGVLRGGAALGRGVAWWAKVTFPYGTLALWLLVAWWLSAGLLALRAQRAPLVGWLRSVVGGMAACWSPFGL